MKYDENFLLKLDKFPNKIIYARVIALNFKEEPLQAIEGVVTQGTINIDGASAVRRTCSLTLAVQNYNIYDYYWGLNTKFKLEIGLQNTIDKSYPDIIWFPQGIFVITSISTSQSTNNFTMTLQGKDKMCLMNGDVGGILEASTDFGKMEEENEYGEFEKTYYPIKDIIRNIVHEYGQELDRNIILNDLDVPGLELLEYRGNKPLYLLKNVGTDYYDNITTQGDLEVYANNGNEEISGSLEAIFNWEQGDYFTLGDNLLKKEQSITQYKINGKWYHIISCPYGSTIGYRFSELVYNQDLTGNAGESLTSILDKIKNFLGPYEYFYDLDGRFVFQKKPSTLQNAWSPLPIKNEDEEQAMMTLKQSISNIYTFYDSELITTFNNNPNLANVKNDFCVWGQRKGVNGTPINIHARLAIHEKPIEYVSLTIDHGDYSTIKDENGNFLFLKGADYEAIENHNILYGTNLGNRKGKIYRIADTEEKDFYHKNEENTNIVYCDWREIIYQMAMDYYTYHRLDDFEKRIKKANKNNGFYLTGKTGYEQYYRDFQGYWRDLYFPKEESDLEINKLQQQIDKENENFYPDIDIINNLSNKIKKLQKDQENYFDINNLQGKWAYGWNKIILYNPENLNFWFDILDTKQYPDLARFSVSNIGTRLKAINDSKIRLIYYPEIPNIIYTEDLYAKDLVGKNDGYSYIHVPHIGDSDMFSISVLGITAIDKLKELLNNYSYCNENATINTIPIYYLQPNTRIRLLSTETGVKGDYIINKLTIPLSYNGTMSITAQKAVLDIM